MHAPRTAPLLPYNPAGERFVAEQTFAHVELVVRSQEIERL